MQSCCFTGHRFKDLPFLEDEADPLCGRIKAQLRDLIRILALEKGIFRYVTGMALGIDQIAAEAVIDLKGELPLILEAALPFEGHGQGWSRAHRLRHDKILESCDLVTALQSEYSIDAYEKRNRYMVDQSDIVLGVWNGNKHGGTYNTIRYARRCQKALTLISIPSLEVTQELSIFH